MKALFFFFANRNKVATLFTISMLLLGVYAITSIQREDLPQADLSTMVIKTRYAGAAPEDVEINVTNKIEDELKSVSGIDTIQSYSMENLSTIEVQIDADISDQKTVKDEIRQAVNRVTDLPDELDSLPAVTEVKSTLRPIVEIGLTGDIPYREMRAIAKRLEKKINQLPGVAQVRKYGYRAREVLINLDPNKLDAYQLSVGVILDAIRARNIQATAGSFESYTNERNLVTLSQFKNPLAVKDVIVRSVFDGESVRIRDLAVIEDSFEQPVTLTHLNGQAAISLLVQKQDNADIIRTVNIVKSAMQAEMQYLPAGVNLIITGDESLAVDARIGVVAKNGITGLILVLIVLSLFLNFKTALWVGIGIPVTLLGVVFLLPVFDQTLNSLALAGMILVLGIVVDDAIIVAENIHRHKEMGKSGIEAAVDGLQEVFVPVLTTMCTTVLAFSPLFFMDGLIGKFIFVIPLVVCLALFISLLEVSIALPAHIIDDKKVVSQQGGVFRRVRQGYLWLISKLLRWRYVVIGCFIVLTTVTVMTVKDDLMLIMFPAESARIIKVAAEFPSNTSLQASSDKIKGVEQLVASLAKEELESFTTRVGLQSDFPEVEQTNIAELTINLTPFSKRTRTAEQITTELNNKSKKLKGFNSLVFTVVGDGPSTGEPILLRVVGTDDTKRAAVAADLIETLSAIAGVKDIERDDKAGKSQTAINIDYEKLAARKITVSDVAATLRVVFDGEVATTIRYGDEDMDFRVIYNKQARDSYDDLSLITIANSDGRLIPFTDIASFEQSPSPANFYHYDYDRAITISAGVDKTVTTAVNAIAQAQASIDSLQHKWPEIRVEVGGESEQLSDSMVDLFKIFLLAAVGIYFLLVLLFNSWGQPLLILVAVPFSLFGVILTFYWHSMALSFLAMLGSVGLAGVVVNDSLVMVEHLNQLIKQNEQDSVIALVAEGATNRLRAIILTTLTTVAGVMPLAYGLGGTDPMLAPMALALGWGLLFATVLTLVLLPCLYMIGKDLAKISLR